MVEHLKDEIERLLGEGEKPAQAERPVRARLAADFTDALGSEASRPASATPLSDDQAAKAAFLDGRQGGTDRAAFVEELAQDQNLRAEVESAAALLESLGSVPPPVPQHLLQQARGQLMPDSAPRRAWTLLRWEWQPRRRVAWAIVAAALTLMVLAPGALLVMGNRLGWQGDEQPAASAQPDADAPQSENKETSADAQPDKETPKCEDPTKQMPPEAQSAEPKPAAEKRKDAQAPSPAPNDPCAPPVPKDDPGASTSPVQAR